MIWNGLYQLALQEDMEKAHRYVEKQQQLARLFEMGRYHEISCELDLAVREQDTEKIQEIKQGMLESLDEITSFTKSPLYQHMKFKESDSTFSEELKTNLLESFESIQ